MSRGTNIFVQTPDMGRKKWEAKTEVTPELIQFRAKRKWQIALRRYVLQSHPSSFYAPYFGLDIETIRKWFEIQFEGGMDWDNFGEQWQFDHVIPVAYFDFEDEEDLKLCWNFINLRIEPIEVNRNQGQRVDIIAAKAYFTELYSKTSYQPCLRLVEKLEQIEISELKSSQKLFDFMVEHLEYIEMIENYSTFEFELLNRGRTIEEVNKEMSFLKKLSS